MKIRIFASIAEASAFKSIAALGLATAFLTACGGGGGGDTAAPAPTTQTAPNPSSQPSQPVTTVVSASVEDTAAFNLLNAERSRCGYGTLLRSNSLDAAARAHADYQAFHGIVDHLEDRTTRPAGFTGTFPLDRVLAQRYATRAVDVGGVADEITALIGTANRDGFGEAGVRSLLNAPYHLRGLVSGYRDVGMSVRTSTDVGSSQPSVYLQINAAFLTSAGQQPFATTDVRTYPCEGTTGVNFQLTNESPNPVPGRDLAVRPLGTSVLISLRPGNRLVLTNSSITQVSTGQTVVTRQPVSGANDPNGPCSEGCFTNSEAYIAADAPLQPNTAYRVNFAGTNNGVAFTRIFTFTTGSGG